MPRRAIDRSRVLGVALRRRREELGLRLQDVVSSTEATGRPIPVSTLSKIEQGTVDPGVLRLHQLLRIYNLPMQVAQDLLDVEEIAGARPSSGDPEQLYEQGTRLWRQGDIENGLAHYVALRELVPEGSALRQRATLAFAVACGGLGKFHLSLNLVQSLLLEPLAPEVRVSVYVQAAIAWDGLGCADVALAFLERAEKHLQDAGHKTRAWVFHKKANVLCNLEQFEESRVSLDLAVEAYREAGDRYGEARAAGMRVRLLVTLGDVRAALEEAREGHRLAEQHGFQRLCVLRMIDEGQMLVHLGEIPEGLRVLQNALAEALSRNDRVAQFYGHYYLAEAYRESGNRELARIERDAAGYFVRFVDESSPETRDIREGGRHEEGNT